MNLTEVFATHPVGQCEIEAARFTGQTAGPREFVGLPVFYQLGIAFTTKMSANPAVTFCVKRVGIDVQLAVVRRKIWPHIKVAIGLNNQLVNASAFFRR